MYSEPLVSIIMGNFNYGRFVAQAIDSVLEQSYQNFEFIIVDDGSKDDSKEIISSYHDSRIKKFFKENGGQASAFNVGFEASCGEIVAFLDSDDWWKPEKLKTLVEWHNFLEGRYSILQHALDVWFDGEVRTYKHILPVGDCFSEMITTRNINFFVPTSGLSIPKKILRQIFPLPEEFRISADAYLMRTAFAFGPVYSIPVSLGYYRQHTNSVFNNKKFNVSNFFENTLFPQLNQFYKKNGIDFELKIKKKPRYHRNIKQLKNIIFGN